KERTSAIDRRLTIDACLRDPVAHDRKYVDRVYVLQLGWTLILILLLALGFSGDRGLGVAAEIRSIAIVRREPATIGDCDLAEKCRHRQHPRLRRCVEWLASVLRAIVVAVCECLDRVFPRKRRPRVTEGGLSIRIGCLGPARVN